MMPQSTESETGGSARQSGFSSTPRDSDALSSLRTTSLIRWLAVKDLPANTGDAGDRSWIPQIGKIPWRRKRQPTPVFMAGESHG